MPTPKYQFSLVFSGFYGPKNAIGHRQKMTHDLTKSIAKTDYKTRKKQTRRHLFRVFIHLTPIGFGGHR